MRRLAVMLLLALSSVPVRAQTPQPAAAADTADRIRDADARRRVLADAVHQHPHDPAAHFALALDYLREPPPPLGAFRTRPIDHARDELREALRRDSTYVPAAVQLAALAVEDRSVAQLDSARHVLRRAGAPGATPRLALALAELELAADRPEAAEAAAAPAVGDREMGGRALRVLGIVHMGRPARADQGVDEYLKGASSDAAAGLYFADAAPLAQPDERDRWQGSGTAEERAGWVADFWQRRAAEAGIGVRSRIIEHFRRMRTADRLYRRPASTAWQSALRKSLSEGAADASDLPAVVEKDATIVYGDRGLVYLRYGPPDRRLLSVRAGGEAWVYWHAADEPLRFYFRDDHLTDDVMTAGELDDLWTADPANASLRARMTELHLKELALHRDLVGLNGREAAMRARAEMESGPVREFQMQRMHLANRNRRRLFTALRHEDARPTFDRALPFYYDLATFRGAAGRTDVVAAFAVPGEALPVERLEGTRAVYAPLIELGLQDGVPGHAVVADTALLLAAARPLVAGQYLRFSLAVAARPSLSAAHRITVRVPADSAVGGTYGGPLPVPDYSGTRLMLSDLVLGEGREGGTWHRGQVALSFIPTLQFPATGAVKLFYEVYNLPAGTPYRTEIAFERSEDGVWKRLKGLFRDANVLALNFEGDAHPDETGRLQEVRIIQPNLAPGRYRIIARVTNRASGENAAAERRFEVMP